MKKILFNVLGTIRALLYSTKYQIGKFCRFEKIGLWHCPRGSVTIGVKTVIMRRTELRSLESHPILIGERVFINTDCIIRPNVSIGDNVSVGQRVSLITDTHALGESEKRAGEGEFGRIKVGNGCWIGACSTVLGGVTIGDGTVIGAGSVVIRDCLPDSLYCGVPARFVKRLPR